eukprot:767245-Hanusia_phi.AAC.1
MLETEQIILRRKLALHEATIKTHENERKSFLVKQQRLQQEFEEAKRNLEEYRQTMIRNALERRKSLTKRSSHFVLSQELFKNDRRSRLLSEAKTRTCDFKRLIMHFKNWAGLIFQEKILQVKAKIIEARSHRFRLAVGFNGIVGKFENARRERLQHKLLKRILRSCSSKYRYFDTWRLNSRALNIWRSRDIKYYIVYLRRRIRSSLLAWKRFIFKNAILRTNQSKISHRRNVSLMKNMFMIWHTETQENIIEGTKMKLTSEINHVTTRSS